MMWEKEEMIWIRLSTMGFPRFQSIWTAICCDRTGVRV